MDRFTELRHKMIQEQIAARGVQDAKVLEAMDKVPREIFVDSLAAAFAYEDTPLPIEEGQTISQPFIVALMTQYAQLKPLDKVLEIGTGSGYSAAILSHLCSHVYSIERHEKLAGLAQERLHKLGRANVTISVKDGTVGWDEHAPYDAIIVTAGGPHIPTSLLKQLAIGGRLIIPVGPGLEEQQLMRVIRKEANDYQYETLGAVRFVPLLGEEGWKNDSNGTRIE